MLRRFAEADASIVARWARTRAECEAWCSRTEFPASPAWFRAWHAEDGVRAYVLEVDGAPRAYGETWEESGEDDVELARLIVDPERRGRGLGRGLVQALRGVVRERGRGGTFLRVRPENAAALACYAGAGFERLRAGDEAEWNRGQPLRYAWMRADDRVARHRRLEARLSSLSDDDLAAHLRTGEWTSTTGGATGSVDVEGTGTFVKRIPLCDVERRPENVESTRNLFDLPLRFHYGISSRGFGAWREVAAHVAASSWVIAGECPHVPLVHHVRVLPRDGSVGPSVAQPGEVDRLTAFWGGSPAIRARLEAIRAAPADVVLFLERSSGTLHDALAPRLAAGGDVAVRALAGVERDLLRATGCLSSKGMVHFDAHFQNVLVGAGALSGEGLRISDFGLASSRDFDLAPDEAAFLDRHRDFDRAYVLTRLVDAAVDAAVGRAARDDVLSRVVEGRDDARLSEPILAFVRPRARVAVVMNDFYRRLTRESTTTPFPEAEVSQALDAL
jgi:ribosomal protein S18 acetylase RimI-like enzyme